MGQFDPALSAGHPFDNIDPSGLNYYWTSTTVSSSTGTAWMVQIRDGAVVQFSPGTKTNSMLGLSRKGVWPVADAP